MHTGVSGAQGLLRVCVCVYECAVLPGDYEARRFFSSAGGSELFVRESESLWLGICSVCFIRARWIDLHFVRVIMEDFD